MKKTLFLTAMALGILNAGATLFITNSPTLTQAVPDNNPNGWVNSISISGQSGTITPGTLAVTLNLSGGWNGDLYAYLQNSAGGFIVLLDRVGMPALNSGYGYGNAGMNVTFTSTGTDPNIHTYGGLSAPTGPWSPDNSALTTASGSWSSFYSNPNATWNLFLADMNGGGVTTVNNWGLQMDIVAVPEVETWVAAALAGAFGAFWLNRQIMAGVKKPQSYQ